MTQMSLFETGSQPTGDWYSLERLKQREMERKAAEAKGPREIHKYWYGKEGHFARHCREVFGGDWRAYWAYQQAKTIYDLRQARAHGDRWYLSVPDFDETEEGKRRLAARVMSSPVPIPRTR